MCDFGDGDGVVMPYFIFSLAAITIYFSYNQDMEHKQAMQSKVFTAVCGERSFIYKMRFDGSSFVGYFNLDGDEISRIPEDCVITSK